MDLDPTRELLRGRRMNHNRTDLTTARFTEAAMKEEMAASGPESREIVTQQGSHEAAILPGSERPYVVLKGGLYAFRDSFLLEGDIPLSWQQRTPQRTQGGRRFGSFAGFISGQGGLRPISRHPQEKRISWFGCGAAIPVLGPSALFMDPRCTGYVLRQRRSSQHCASVISFSCHRHR